ncbi:LysR family transcriptional regulator [Rhodobacteraceae bacterium SC52]|nr:LysR family transcriptional regulator [Rhodobacteraceae bacterium SC52]
MLNATWLETFTTLCETGHFTRTARLLNMTQPGVSQHLRKLEEQIGQPLIARHGRTFAVTGAGEAVLALGRARRAEEKLLRDVIGIDDPDSGGVHVACSGSFATLLYPQILPWMQSAPKLAIHLEAGPNRAIQEGVLDGRFDLGILSDDPAHARLDARYLGREELCLVLPADAPDVPITFADLEARGFVAHPDGNSYADDLLQVNFPNEYSGADRLRVRAYVNQIGQIPAPVAHSVGYTLLPRSGIDSYARRGDLRIADLPERRWLDLWMVARRGRPASARLTRMMEIIAQVAAGLS